MWKNNRLAKLLGIQYPLIQAPMAAATTPEMAAASTNAGGLGSLGAAMLNPEALLADCRALRERTNGSFNINFFVHKEPVPDPAKDEAARELLTPMYKAVGLDDVPEAQVPFPSFDSEQLEIMLSERPAVVSFHFGLPDANAMQSLKEYGAVILCSATNVAEAKELEARGIDAVIAQGFEAGGHRGTFAEPYEAGQVGTMALVPQIVDAIDLPVIAAGGIADGRGIAAALALGAEGVQIGTAFLRCPESLCNSVYRDALTNAGDDATRITSAFSGRPARGIENRFMREMAGSEDQLPDFPIPNTLTGAMRVASAKTGTPEFMSLWSGQAGALGRDMPTGELMETLIRETNEVLARLGG